MTWKQRFDRMKKGMGWTNKHLAHTGEYSEDSVKVITNRKELPGWLKVAIVVYETLNGLDDV